MPAPDRSHLIYTLDRPGAYRLVTVVLVVLALGLGGLALSLRPEDLVEEFSSIAVGRIVQVAMLLCGLGTLAAWLWFRGRYVRRMAWLPEEGRVELELGRLLGPRVVRLSPADFRGATVHEGRMELIDAPSVRAPYRKLRIRGHPALILDDRGTVHDRRALNRILAGRPPDRPPEPQRR